jgi:hypothetical protein
MTTQVLNNVNTKNLSKRDIKEITLIQEEFKSGFSSYEQAILDLQHLSCNVLKWSEEQYNEAYQLIDLSVKK